MRRASPFRVAEQRNLWEVEEGPEWIPGMKPLGFMRRASLFRIAEQRRVEEGPEWIPWLKRFHLLS